MPERLWRHLAFLGVFSVPLPDGRQFRLRHGGHRVENEIFWKGIFGQWERTSLRLWYELARKANCIVDVGANSGVYSMLAATANPDATILAIEPLPAAVTQLRHNIELNDAKVLVFEGVLSDSDANATLHLSPSAFQYSASLHSEFSVELTETLSVQAKTLDRLIEEYSLPLPDLVKIDVEGHEPSVLRGMRHALESSHPELLVEVLDEHSLSNVLDVTRQFKYRYQWIDESRGLSEQKPLDPHSRNIWLRAEL